MSQIAKRSIFLDRTLCSPLKVNRRFGGTRNILVTYVMLVSCFDYSSILKIEAT
jgi:hypothetical protein